MKLKPRFCFMIIHILSEMFILIILIFEKMYPRQEKAEIWYQMILKIQCLWLFKETEILLVGF